VYDRVLGRVRQDWPAALTISGTLTVNSGGGAWLVPAFSTRRMPLW
jgi:hypothetical protein